MHICYQKIFWLLGYSSVALRTLFYFDLICAHEIPHDFLEKKCFTIPKSSEYEICISRP